MRGLNRISAAIGAAAAGIGAAVFLHPRAGARNRKAAAGVAKRQSANVATMVGATVARPARRSARNDTSVAEAVRARLGERHPHADVQVSAHRGTVTLRGEVTRLRDIDALELTARSVEGVDDVNNLLRLASATAST